MVVIGVQFAVDPVTGFGHSVEITGFPVPLNGDAFAVISATRVCLSGDDDITMGGDLDHTGVPCVACCVCDPCMT